MCGIVGIYNFDGRPVDSELVRRMSGALAHRGPDDGGFFFSDFIALGARRLSIVDVDGGAQPMQTADRKVTIVFNGEIYNYRELRADLEANGQRFETESDTETILRAYLAFGVDCIARLNGMFAFAIWDERSRTLLVARDHIGIKPLYLYRANQQLRFASEIKGLLADSALPKSLNENALGHFLRYGFVGGHNTLFDGISRFPPGHYLLANGHGSVMHDYGKAIETCQIDDEQSAAQQLRAALGNSVRRQAAADVPVGIFLSGGIDSSSIVHFMSASSASPVRTYSVGYDGKDAFYDEREYASYVADFYGTRHEEIVITPRDGFAIPDLVSQLDEPSRDSSFLVTFLLAKHAARTVKVVLSGLGGDELFGGYRRYLGPALAPYFRKLPGPVWRTLSAILRHTPADRGSLLLNYARLCRGFLLAYELPAFEQYDRMLQIMPDAVLSRIAPSVTAHALDAGRSRRNLFEASGQTDVLGRTIALDMKTTLVDQMLMLTDRMTMAVGLEARVPFLDREVLDIARRLPSSMKIKGLNLRHVQKLSMRGLLPSACLRRRKRGFGCPIGRWFRDELREMLCDVLSSDRLSRSKILDVQVVQTLIREHTERAQDHSDALLALLTFELWRSQWFG